MLAITLQRKDFREYDQVVTFYTKETGKIEPVARGIKKIVSKNAPALEPFSLLDIEIVPGLNFSYITKAFVVENFPFIRDDSKKLVTAFFILSLVNKIVKVGDRDQNIFKLLHSVLKYINESKNISTMTAAAFVARLICFLGFTPVLARCSTCGKNNFKKIYFVAEEGGIICEDCALKKNINGVALSAKLLKKLHAIFIDNWKKLDDDNLSIAERNEVSGCVISYARYHFGVKITLPVEMF